MKQLVGLSGHPPRPVRLLVFCAVETGWDAVDMVVKSGAQIAAVVGLGASASDRSNAAGWVDVEQYAQRVGVPFVAVDDYSLRSSLDRARLEGLSFDLIWVAGWQRLIPDDIIALANLGGIGSHGSPWGIAGGRGRSPQNWALIMGCEDFHLSLFRLTSEPDAGHVILSRTVKYNSWDTIDTSYKKMALETADMVIEVLSDTSLIHASRPQPGSARYLPQRLPSDGQADWHSSAIEIHNHCRALTHPYPGLRSGIGDQAIILWDLVPFDDFDTRRPGLIGRVFMDGSFLVSADDGRLLVRDYEVLTDRNVVEEGALLDSVPFSQTWGKIRERHLAKHPGKQLVDFAGSPRPETK